MTEAGLAHGAVALDGTSNLCRRLQSRIAAILKASREDQDLSQAEVASRLGWARNMIANIESGRRAVRFTDVVLIAKAINVDVERIVHRVLQW